MCRTLIVLGKILLLWGCSHSESPAFYKYHIKGHSVDNNLNGFFCCIIHKDGLYIDFGGTVLVGSPSFCGAGGSRTLVQTCCKSAFYMFSLGLIVGGREVPDGPSCRLSSKFSLPHRSLRSLSCHFRYFGPDAGGRGFRGSTRNYGPCPCREIRGN